MNPVELTLSAAHGTLTLASTAGLMFVAGDGTADGTMTVRGTLAALNAALDGLSFAPDANYFGAGRIHVLVDDLGNSGTGGAKAPGDVSIQVTPVNDAPTAGADHVAVVGGATSSLDVLANDSSAPDVGETLAITTVTQGTSGGTVVIVGSRSTTRRRPASPAPTRSPIRFPTATAARRRPP